MTPLRFSNKNGFPCLESINATLTSTGLTYTFNKHPFVLNYFYGGIFFKLKNTPAAPTNPVSVYFTTAGVNNSTVLVLDSAGDPITTNTIGDAIYLAFYDRDTNKLQILSTL